MGGTCSMWEMRYTYKILTCKHQRMILQDIHMWENIANNLGLFQLAKDMVQLRAFVNMVMKLWMP
jgi:hypothetical protein